MPFKKGQSGNQGKKFKAGQSGNPSGRPHKQPVTDRYRELLETPLPDDIRKALGLKAGSTHGDAIALAQARQAIKGKTDAAREIREAVEGKSTQRVELTGKDGAPVAVTHTIRFGDGKRDQ